MPSSKDTYIYFEPFTEDEIRITSQKDGEQGVTLQTNTRLLVSQMTSRMVEIARRMAREARECRETAYEDAMKKTSSLQKEVASQLRSNIESFITKHQEAIDKELEEALKQADQLQAKAKQIYREAVSMENYSLKLARVKRDTQGDRQKTIYFLGEQSTDTREVRINHHSNTIYIPYQPSVQNLTYCFENSSDYFDNAHVLVITGHGNYSDTPPKMYKDKRAVMRVSEEEYSRSVSQEEGISAEELVRRLENAGFNGMPSTIKLNMCFSSYQRKIEQHKQGSFASELAEEAAKKWPNVTVIGYNLIVGPHRLPGEVNSLPLITDSRYTVDGAQEFPGGLESRHRYPKQLIDIGAQTTYTANRGIIIKFNSSRTRVSESRLSQHRDIFPSKIQRFIKSMLEQSGRALSEEVMQEVFPYGIEKYRFTSERIHSAEIKRVLDSATLKQFFSSAHVAELRFVIEQFVEPAVFSPSQKPHK